MPQNLGNVTMLAVQVYANDITGVKSIKQEESMYMLECRIAALWPLRQCERELAIIEGNFGSGYFCEGVRSLSQLSSIA